MVYITSIQILFFFLIFNYSWAAFFLKHHVKQFLWKISQKFLIFYWKNVCPEFFVCRRDESDQVFISRWVKDNIKKKLPLAAYIFFLQKSN